MFKVIVKCIILMTELLGFLNEFLIEEQES